MTLALGVPQAADLAGRAQATRKSYERAPKVLLGACEGAKLTGTGLLPGRIAAASALARSLALIDLPSGGPDQSS